MPSCQRSASSSTCMYLRAGAVLPKLPRAPVQAVWRPMAPGLGLILAMLVPVSSCTACSWCTPVLELVSGGRCHVCILCPKAGQGLRDIRDVVTTESLHSLQARRLPPT